MKCVDLKAMGSYSKMYFEVISAEAHSIVTLRGTAMCVAKAIIILILSLKHRLFDTIVSAAGQEGSDRSSRLQESYEKSFQCG